MQSFAERVLGTMTVDYLGWCKPCDADCVAAGGPACTCGDRIGEQLSGAPGRVRCDAASWAAATDLLSDSVVPVAKNSFTLRPAGVAATRHHNRRAVDRHDNDVDDVLRVNSNVKPFKAQTATAAATAHLWWTSALSTAPTTPGPQRNHSRARYCNTRAPHSHRHHVTSQQGQAQCHVGKRTGDGLCWLGVG